MKMIDLRLCVSTGAAAFDNKKRVASLLLGFLDSKVFSIQILRVEIPGQHRTLFPPLRRFLFEGHVAAPARENGYSKVRSIRVYAAFFVYQFVNSLAVRKNDHCVVENLQGINFAIFFGPLVKSRRFVKF